MRFDLPAYIRRGNIQTKQNILSCMEKLSVSRNLNLQIKPKLNAVLNTLSATFLSPYIRRGIAKDRLQLKSRLQFIADVRVELSSVGFSMNDYRNSENFIRSRPHLSKELQEKILNFEMDSVPAHGSITKSQRIKEEIYQELFELEEKWGLV